MIGIHELLIRRGLPVTAKAKVVRHQNRRCSVAILEREGLVELYQSYQSDPVFKCEYVVSFVGLENSRARLFGVYKVVGTRPAIERPLEADFPYPWFFNPAGLWYDLERQPGFEDLIGRVVIDWGSSTLAWHQWLNPSSDKEVVEILPAGYVREFPGYLDFVLSFDELVAIVSNPLANREWHRMLGAVAGVYLIVDGKSGKQYVGSAAGEAGVLGRWKEYAVSRHGGNQQLVDLLASDPEAARHFSFTLLRTLPRTLTKAEVVACESLYKRKLGSRAFGLNSN